jgi:predicted RNase H-like HicB family nuclease
MLYPVYVYPGDDGHAHGVTVPDMPGCFTAVDNWDALGSAVQEAIELYFEGEDMEVPKPSSLDTLMQDASYEGGIWMLVDIDLSRVRPKAQRLNVTLSQPLVRRIDGYAKQHGETRSGFLARAAERLMDEAE